MRNIFKIDLPVKRNFGLDLLRFIAIFTVLISHSIVVLPPKYYIVHHFIFDGVLVFFVLSGFLIGRIFIRDFEQEFTIKKLFYFWQRRWWRTLPAFYFTVILMISLNLLYSNYLNKIEVLKTSFFVQNLNFNKGIFFSEAWSLSIEEWFYLTIPILCFFNYKLLRTSIKTNILLLFIYILIFSIINRTYIFSTREISTISQWDQNLRSTIVTRLDSLLMGVLAAWFYSFKKEFFIKNKNALFIIGLTIFIANKIYTDYFLIDFDNYYISVIYFSLIPFSISLMIPYLYYFKGFRVNFIDNIISKGSLISYSLYLINPTIIYLFLLKININYWIKFGLYWILTIYASIIMYKYIEVYFMKFRK